MKIITEKNIRDNLKRYGFKSADEDTISLFNNSFNAFMKKTLDKAQKIAKGDKVKEEHVIRALGVKQAFSQSGGAETTLPLEYFGVESGHYHENPSKGIDMSVTDEFVRPALEVNDPAGVIEKFNMDGGSCKSCKFSLSRNAVQKACTQYGSSISVKSRAQIQNKFEDEMSDVMDKVKKLNRDLHLSGGSLDKVLSQQKFSKLFKD